MSQERIDILERSLKREKAARKQAEKILEDKSRDLYFLSEKLKNTNLQLENLLDEKSTQLEGVFENIVDAYVVMDLKGNVLKFNDPAIDLFGYNINIEPLNIVTLIYKEDMQYAMSSFFKLHKKGFFKNYEARVITKSKEVKWVHINASIIFDKNKKPIAAQGIVRDITDLKYKKEIIENQRKELTTIVDKSPFGIVLTKFGEILKTNKALQNLFGFSEKEFKQLTIKDISVKENFLKSKELLDKMNSGKIDNFEINKRYIKKNGNIIWAKTNVTAVRDAFGEINYQIAIIEDVTSKRKEKLIIDTINTSAKSILGKDDIYEIAWAISSVIANYLNTEDCVIYLVNNKTNSLEQIATFHKKEIINKIIIPFGKGIVGDVAKKGKSEIINNTSKDKRYVIDGEKRLSEITIPITSDGKVIGIIDIEHKDENFFTTEHLKTIESIANLVSVQLKSAINLRERKRAEEDNIELLKKIKKSNEELQEYAHIVSHDLKSPLRSIDALVSWIKLDNKGKFDDITLQNFNLLDTTLETMETLISNVLEYSSIGSTNEEDNVDLNSLLINLKKILFIPENISVNISSKLPTVKGDVTKFQQLFQNLISNAIKFNNKEKGIVEVNFTEKKSFYQFEIKDNGIGIEKKYHDKIFKIFHSLNESKDSSGIGLSIVKKIIDLYDGDIWLESEPEIGTTFYFTIKK